MTMSRNDRRQQKKFEPLFDIHPVTGASIEVFYADPTLESFGRLGAGWFWWSRRRGFSPDGPAIGPFATSFAAFRDAMIGRRLRTTEGGAGDKVNADILRTRRFS